MLEIGSAGGRDALALEERGLAVRRTDVTPAFVELMRSRGYDADVLDPLTDDAGRAVRRRLGQRLPAPRRAGGPADRAAPAGRGDQAGRRAGLSLKEGDGEEWSVHGHVRAPRRFVYWREAPLRAVLADAGWRVQELAHEVGGNGQAWLDVRAVQF